MSKRGQPMTRHKLMIICYLSLSICAQAGSLTPKEDSEIESLVQELAKSGKANINYAQSFVWDDDSMWLSECFSDLADSTNAILSTLVNFFGIAHLSAEMVDKNDESKLNEYIFHELDSSIEELGLQIRSIEGRQRNCHRNNLFIVKSEYALQLAKRAADLLSSAKRHFER
jgi:hypothetical protein